MVDAILHKPFCIGLMEYCPLFPSRQATMLSQGGDSGHKPTGGPVVFLWGKILSQRHFWGSLRCQVFFRVPPYSRYFCKNLGFVKTTGIFCRYQVFLRGHYFFEPLAPVSVYVQSQLRGSTYDVRPFFDDLGLSCYREYLSEKAV